MASQEETEIVLYDLACTKDVCFSPVAWRIRLMLNYKRIPYRTVFLEFPDIEPTLKGLGVIPSDPTPGNRYKYTVPTIHHLPTNTYTMDSASIAPFLESTYPDPPVPITSDLGSSIQAKTRALVGPLFRMSITPRELGILSPRSQDYFRRTREEVLGHRLEELLPDPEKEDEGWKAADEGMRATGELMRANNADGPFVLGATPSYADFSIAGSIQCARTVDEGVFQRIVKYPGYKEIYEACLPYMEKRD